MSAVGSDYRGSFDLRFAPAEIPKWAARYEYPGEEEIANVVGPRCRERGSLTKSDFLKICEWKSPRIRSRCEANPATRVEEATALALAGADSRIKIGVLRVLSGVDWATASVILHFCDTGPYPILDFRALWSLGFDRPPRYTYRFWEAYTQAVRELQSSTGDTMRVIDRALWQYSKDNQR